MWPLADVAQYCKIAPLCTVAPGEELPDFTVVYGFNERRQERPGLEGLRAKAHEKHVQVLKMLIPSNLAKWETGA
jgi:dynactin-6